MQPKRVLHIVGAMNRGGAEILLMELYRNMDKTKIQFDFIVHGREKGIFDDEIVALGGKIFNLENRFSSNPIKYLQEWYCFFVRHPEYECIHSHLNDMSGYVLWMAKKAANRVTIAHSHVSYPQIDILRRITWWLGRKLITDYADVMLGCSAAAIVYLSGLAPDNLNRIVMKNAIDIPCFSFDNKLRDSVRQEFHADQETFIIGNVARFGEEKNHRFILSVFQAVLAAHKNSLLVLIGTGTLVTAIQEEAKQMNIASRVKFLGDRSDVHEILNAMDVFIMPSLYEGLGIVLVEAQANGLPCVASDTIPQEADIHTGLMNFISLQENVNIWRDAVLQVNRADNTADPQVAAKLAGYDIHEVAFWLQSFYINKIYSRGYQKTNKEETKNGCLFNCII